MQHARFRRGLAERQGQYLSTAAQRAQTWQLQAWNAEWHRILQDVPFYERLRARRLVPERFDSWEQFVDVLPAVDREEVHRSGHLMASRSRAPEFHRMTGGSTAQPVQLPAWRSESRVLNLDIWLARGWYGITPRDRLFLLWGHSHLMGTGHKGRVARIKRRMKDRALGYDRISAYDLQQSSLEVAVDEMLRRRPTYVIGYSVALDLLARANLDRGPALRGLRLKAVLGAAEGFPSEDSEELLSALTGSPVGMEYGSVETGLVAHTHPEGGYRAFWRTYFIEGEARRDRPGFFSIRITSLYPRCFPLVRYELGDEIKLDPAGAGVLLGIREFHSVAGRSNDYVVLADGALIHSETFSHAVRLDEWVRGYQVIQDRSSIVLRVLADMPVDEAKVRVLRARLGSVHPLLSDVFIERVASLEQTIAGKVPMVLRRP